MEKELKEIARPVETPLVDGQSLTLPQCNEILPNTRQQCTRPGYATIVIEGQSEPLAYCRLHFSIRMNDTAQFKTAHIVCDPSQQDDLDRLLSFFAQVAEHKEKVAAAQKEQK